MRAPCCLPQGCGRFFQAQPTMRGMGGSVLHCTAVKLLLGERLLASELRHAVGRPTASKRCRKRHRPALLQAL